MPYHMKDFRDSQDRSAWIVAAGLAGRIDTAMPVFFDPLPNRANDEEDPCDGFGKPNDPITRIIHTLRFIKTAFSAAPANGKTLFKGVIKAATVMHGTRTESNGYSFIVGTIFTILFKSHSLASSVFLYSGFTRQT